MTEIKKAPARTGANANTVVIAPFTKAILTRVQAIYNGNEVIAGGSLNKNLNSSSYRI